MKLIIDIDEDTYKYMQSRCKYQNKGDKGLSKFEEAGVAIKNGTPLSKGHGRLIDTNEITAFRELECNGHNIKSLDEFTVIIEADKESEE